jgi:hypothetical protein
VKPELQKYEPLIPIEEAKRKHLSAVLAEAEAIIKDFKPSKTAAPKPSLKANAVKFQMPAKGAAF